MKLPRRTIFASGRGRCRAAGRVAHRLGASLSDAAGAHHCRRSVPAVRPTLSRGSSGNGCRSGSASNSSSKTARAPAAISAPRRSCGRRRTAIRSSWSSSSNAINATLYDKLNFNFIRDIAPVAGIIRLPFVMVVNPSVPAKTVPEFIAYAKANPGKINMASPGNGTPRPCERRAVQDDDRRRNGSRAVSRRGRRGERLARRTSASLVRHHVLTIE